MADIRKVMDEMEPRVRKAFEDAMRDITSRVQIEIVEKAIAERRFEDAIRALNMSPAAFGPIEELIQEAYRAGGRDALAALPAIADPFLLATLWSALIPGMLEPRLFSEPIRAVA